jgi:hypothetical protein
MDDYLEKRLQNWAAQQKPPDDGKMRLLRAISCTSNRQYTEPSLPDSGTHWFSIGSIFRKGYHNDAPRIFEWPVASSFEINLFKFHFMY